jgi:hypothetical protein
MTQNVELFSITSPEINPSSVLYYTEFNSVRSEASDDHSVVLAQAQALVQEHGACLVDRSDKGTGLALGQRRH